MTRDVRVILNFHFSNGRCLPIHQSKDPTMPNNDLAIYPGSFDPITNGHVDLVKRTLRVFDHVIVAIATNPEKDRSLFSLVERIDMVNEVFSELKGRVSADSFKGLLVDYAESKGATVVIRGLRAISDFEYEFQMASRTSTRPNTSKMPPLKRCAAA